ncbi:uncharacterized protein [Ptychodera flava]|uniref:uncharacterized protein n=1 Tax=Ptychodera flava TaxID=63121 RepID=UPI00396A3F44
MATEEASRSDTVYKHLEAVRSATDDKQKRWSAVHDSLVQTFDISEFSKYDWSTRRDVRKAIFDEQQNLIEVIACFTGLQANRLRALDIFKAIKIRVNYEFQTIDDFVHEAKLDKHLNLFKERELSSLLDILNVDINELRPHMRHASIQRLTKTIESIRTVTEYCDSQLQVDIDRTAEKHVAEVNKIADHLQQIINRLYSRWEEFRTNAVTEQRSKESHLLAGYFDKAKRTVSNATSSVYARFFPPSEGENQSIRKKRKVETNKCVEEDTKADDDEGFVHLYPLTEEKSNTDLESWKTTAIAESFQVKQLFYSLQELLAAVLKQSHQSKDTRNCENMTKCLNDTEKLLEVYLNDIDGVMEQLSHLSKQ